jgi:hypothetical protein
MSDFKNDLAQVQNDVEKLIQDFGHLGADVLAGIFKTQTAKLEGMIGQPDTPEQTASGATPNAVSTDGGLVEAPATVAADGQPVEPVVADEHPEQTVA